MYRNNVKLFLGPLEKSMVRNLARVLLIEKISGWKGSLSDTPVSFILVFTVGIISRMLAL